MLVTAGFVFAEHLAIQNKWDPRVYDPLGIQTGNTIKTSGFYNISLLISSNDNATVNKILFDNASPLNIQNQNTINQTIYINGTALQQPFNMQDSDHAQANLLIPIDNLQSNSTYAIEVYIGSGYYYISWNSNYFFNIPSSY